MGANGVTLLSHAKASVEQIGLVGCRDSPHISLNKRAVLQLCVCALVCVCLGKQQGTHLVWEALRGFVCASVCALCVSEHAISCEV